jgi:spore coat protein CotH
MSKHKYTTAICIVITIVTVIITAFFGVSSSFGMQKVQYQPAYENNLFDTSKVHSINIVVKESDWENLLDNALAKEYIPCSVVIDGETVKNVGIRTKGNSTLASIASSTSNRYSFKVEFDHYEKGQNYLGLDKLSLNNIAQDNTYMKDYVSYQMMNMMGADSPLSSFMWVTINGEDWGLYLAVEGVEEAFSKRVYGNQKAQIYKPDSMDIVGKQQSNDEDNDFRENQMPNFLDGSQIPDIGNMPEGNTFPGSVPPNFGNGGIPEFPGFSNGFGEQMEKMPQIGNIPEQDRQVPESENFQNIPFLGNNDRQFLQIPNINGRGFGNTATSLIYTDDNPESYSAIFDKAITKVSKADKKRLISSIKQLNENKNIENVVDVDEVIRYFVVHNFVLNGDSYTGSMVHNYYLSEIDGMLSMIAWDYNLAFGAFGMGAGMDKGDFTIGSETNLKIDNATKLVNYPIDSPLLSGIIENRPMLAWIFNDENYLSQYHEVFAEFMEFFNDGRFGEMYDNAISLISPYVKKDPTAFVNYEDFEIAQETLKRFCLLRAESISGQLDGTIASSSSEQSANGYTGFIDASDIDMDIMGSNMMGFDRGPGNRFSPFPVEPETNNFQGFNSDNAEMPSDDKDSDFITERQTLPNISQNISSIGNKGRSNLLGKTGKEMAVLVTCIIVLILGIIFAKKKHL